MREKASHLPIIRLFTSVKLTALCLFLLFILTFLGTLDQVGHGLYLAQERFFYSFGFLLFGVIPFPGAQLVMWILFINLSMVTVFRFKYRLKNAGIFLIHLGILTILVSAFFTYHFMKESQLTLYEGEGSNVSLGYHDWELAVFKEKEGKREVIAYDANDFRPGTHLNFEEFGFDVEVRAYYPNSQAYTLRDEKNLPSIINDSGIHSIAAVSSNNDPLKNIAGGAFTIHHPKYQNAKILLYGAESNGTQIKIKDEGYRLQLRRKRLVLPFALTLIDFRMEKHPATEVARRYESTVEIWQNGVSREAVISMNNPLRYNNYTFYQASYAIDAQGREQSTLAVVKNVGRILPYVSCLLTITGLMVHFGLMYYHSSKMREPIAP